MSVKVIVITSVLVLIGFIGLMLISGVISWSNNEIDLKNGVFAQQKKNEAVFDKTWKTISQTVQVSDKYKDSFKDVYKEIMAGRYSADKKSNPVFKWIQEANIQFSDRIYEKLMTVIEANRAEFLLEQSKLIDINNEHTKLIEKFPGSIYNMILNRAKIDIAIVTSTKTEEVFKSRKDDDIKLN
ncbi:MAG: hypothetical protein IMZ63_03515 [Actinobacteria bacterium]|nr:hypothetical protein [Actinomycetota bacterium]